MNITKHIRELCDEQGIDYKELHQRILKAMEDDNNYDDYPDISIVNRWYNTKTKSVDEKYIKYIAVALRVTEDEIKLGKSLNPDFDALERIKKQLELDEDEKNRIAKVLYLDRYYLRIISFVCAMYGLFLLNNTLWNNRYVFFFTALLFFLALKYDKKKYLKETGQRNRTVVEGFRENIETIKMLFKKALFNRILLLLFVLMSAVFFFPFIESLFYKGTFYLSTTILLLVAIVLFVESLTRK